MKALTDDNDYKDFSGSITGQKNFCLFKCNHKNNHNRFDIFGTQMWFYMTLGGLTDLN